MGAKRAIWAAVAVASLALAACGGQKPVDGARIAGADSNPGEWVTHGRTYSEQRFSPLEKINAGNVGELGLAWSFDLPENRGIEATPLVADGVMYTTSAWSVVRAFDAKTGKVVWSKVTVDQSKPYTITGAPRVVKGKVLIGNGGAELGVRGYLSAYDAETGDMAWRFYTVPGEKETDGAASDKAMKDVARKTWNGEFWKIGGGGTVWDSMAYDPELDLLYIGVGNGSPWNRDIRSPGGGDNLFLSSIVALKPETWDYTATQHIVLADLTIEGKPRKVLMQAPKNGFFYVLDRTNGKFISAEKYVSAVNWATGIDKTTGRPIEAPGARYEKTLHLSNPGPLGAHNWHPMAFSPATGLVYIPAQEIPFPYMQPGGDKANFKYRAQGWNVGIDFLVAGLPDDEAQLKAIRASLKGKLVAWDPVAQKARWTVDYDGPWNGGLLATAGNLVFQGSATGEFAAYSADSGKKLWGFDTQTGVVAPAMTYEIDGEQYVALMAGYGGGFAVSAGAGVDPRSEGPRRLLVFKLGAKNKLPARPVSTKTPLTLPATPGTPQQIATGNAVFAANCGVCHGASGVSNFSIPDLRYSPTITDAAIFKSIVIDGDRKEQGMVSFASLVSVDEAESVRQYLLDLSRRQQVMQKAAGK